MRIINSKIQGLGKTPVLTWINSSTPMFLPFVYLIVHLKNKSYKTKYNNISAIKHLFKYYDQNSIQLEEVIIQGDFQLIISKIDSYTIWLYHKGYLPKTNYKPMSNQFYDINLRAVKDFLKWAALKYSIKTDYSQIIEDKFSSHYIHFPSNNRRAIKSLDKVTVDLLRSIIKPGSTHNPFLAEQQLRNWIITEMLLMTGMRCGELLKLKTTDVVKNGSSYYVRIIKRNEDIEDSRSNEPSIKNIYGQRVIAINEWLYSAYEKYLIKYRKNRKGGKKAKVAHGFVFTSELGKPLSQNTVNEIFKKIDRVIKTLDGNYCYNITPHSLRHTFAETMLEFLVEEKNIEIERAKDELRSICGWSYTSPMPSFYASKYFDKKANSHNLNRIEEIFLRNATK